MNNQQEVILKINQQVLSEDASFLRKLNLKIY